MDYPNKKTRRSYGVFLNNYFKTIKTDPTTYFDNGRDFEADVTTFWHDMVNRNIPPLSINQTLSVVRMFLEENNVVIPKKTWKKIKKKTKGSRAQTMDRVPTNHELKQILSHGGAKERALFFTDIFNGPLPKKSGSERFDRFR